ncbi:MAG TPA: RNB domain-containing ribonuclease, partial [Casimicrobiaceae bacterium]|nr:RNB domain-containing ribonuclease [Casimicrobiaceae bacterium]
MPAPAAERGDDLRDIARRAMRERGLLPDFSPEASKQAAAVVPPAAEASDGMRDQRDLRWASIDNDDSRDLDQLSVGVPLAGGATRIMVAIADVDATVKIGSPIDQHAQANTTSVYTAAEIFPMLPERLSTDLTSLAEGEDRMAVVVDMTIDAGGAITASGIYRALVRNHAKLAYNGVAAWLDGSPPPAAIAADPGIAEQIRLQDRVAQTLRRVRR